MLQKHKQSLALWEKAIRKSLSMFFLMVMLSPDANLSMNIERLGADNDMGIYCAHPEE